MRSFAIRVANEIDARGVLDVLRYGVKDRGVQVDLCYFRPGLLLAKDALREYNLNVVSVARQLHFSPRDKGDSVDLAFFVNGLPLASVELKNPMTGQNADHAIEQYRRRDPNELFFARRALVHFAVDPDRAFVTTRLRGRDTEFLPFNVGSAGAGNSGGAGNPATVRDDYRVSYLWENIWQRDNWLDILHRYLHVQTDVGRRTARIPRRVSSRAITSGTPCRRWSPTRGPAGRGRTTWSSIRPGRGSRTRSRGSRTGCPTCSRTRTSRCSTRSW